MSARPSRNFGGRIRAAVEAIGIAKSFDGKVGGTVPATNKVNEVNSDTTLPTQAFNVNSSTQSDIRFSVPQTIGKVIDALVRFDVKLTGTADSVNLVPASYVIQRQETFLGNNSLEVVESDAAHMETFNWLSVDELLTVQGASNVLGRNNYPCSAGGSTSTIWLPLWASCFTQAQPYIRAFTPKWNFRFTFASDIVAHAYDLSGNELPRNSVSVSLQDCKMYFVEAALSAAQEAELMNSHGSGIDYRTIVRTPFIYNANFQKSQQVNQQLTSFNSDTAGIAFWLRDSNPAPADVLRRYTVQQHTVRTAGNVDLLHQLLPADLFSVFVNSYQVPGGVDYFASFDNTGSSSTDGLYSTDISGVNYPIAYVESFCSNLNKALTDGAFTGGLKLSADQRLVFTVADTPNPAASQSLQAVAYEYAVLKVNNYEGRLERHA